MPQARRTPRAAQPAAAELRPAAGVPAALPGDSRGGRQVKGEIEAWSLRLTGVLC